MGKHKHKKDKKKHKKQKKKSQTSSSSEDEWVEKKMQNSSDNKLVETKVDNSSNIQEMLKYKRKYSNSDSEDDGASKKTSEDKNDSLTKSSARSDHRERDEWMSLSTSFSFVSNSDRKQKREQQKNLERQKQQYNPNECTRELNPYWKHGGDGLPKFKKPDDSQNGYTKNYSKQSYKSTVTSNWRKKNSDEKHALTSHEPNSEESREHIAESNDEGVALSEKELNTLAAKLVKAEILGNTKLVKELKDKLENARHCHKDNRSKDKSQEEQILLTHTNAQGQSKPVKPILDCGESSGYHKRKKNIETHSGGQRVRYFADDDQYSLKQMFENEKYESTDSQNKEFVKMAQKIRKNDDFDDMFADNIRRKESDDKSNEKNRARAINESQRISNSLDNCKKCIQSEFMLKHLMVSMTETSYIALPEYEPLTKGHCFIIPIRHVPCSTQLDENEWSEILNIRKSLVKLFETREETVVFFETAMSLHRLPHMCIECVPLPKTEGDLAPIYFKKAIDESESEWAHNKKLISLKGRDVRKAIPKGLSYFAVSFGIDDGFAHVIEDEQLFPHNFAQEIIGGMLDLHHSIWRKPKLQKFEEQSKRVLEFSKVWKAFECTF